MVGSTSFLMANKNLIKETDLETAVLFSELAAAYDYLSEKGLLSDGYFYRTQQEIEENTTLSPKQQLRCVRILEEKGLIKTKLKGLPAKKYFTIDSSCIARFSQILQKVDTCIDKKDKQDCTKSINKFIEICETSLAENAKQVSTNLLINNNKVNNNKSNNNKIKEKESFPRETIIVEDREKFGIEETVPDPKIKKIKSSEKVSPVFVYPANFTDRVIRAVENFFEYRAEIKKPFRSEKSRQTKIEQLSQQITEYGEEIVLDSIETAIANGWQGTFIDMKKVKSNNHKTQYNGNSKNAQQELYDFIAKATDFEL